MPIKRLEQWYITFGKTTGSKNHKFLDFVGG